MPAPFALTPEQAAAREAFLAGRDLALEAGAGTGKTATLKVLGHARHSARGVYLAYNRMMSEDARSRMPGNVSCSTTHSIAYRWIGQKWGLDILGERLRAPRVPTKDAARILGVTGGTRINENVVLGPARLISIVMETVRNYCYSADRLIKARHVPTRAGIDDPDSKKVLAALIPPLAQRAWEEITRPKGRLRLEHDTYLKLLCLSDLQIPCDFLLLDEAQDTNPAVAAMFLAQRNTHRVAVGDSNQSIYGWRGATDFLSQWAMHPGVQHQFLSMSFRFGPAIAEWANMWLTLLNADLRVTGTDTVPSRVERIADLPNAILCRSNARAVEEVIGMHERGVKVHLAGRADDVKRLAEACMELREKGWTSHPELVAFTTWGSVVEYAEETSEGADLAVAVKLIETHSPEGIIDALARCVPAGHADVVISTAHGSKGQEWGRVRIADDFKDPRDGDTQLPMQPEEMRLGYVAVTRAKEVLDPAGVRFVQDRYRSHQARRSAALAVATAT